MEGRRPGDESVVPPAGVTTADATPAVDPGAAVSTPLNRRGMRRIVFRAFRQAERRRRGVLTATIAITAATVLLATAGTVTWWGPVVGAAVTGLWTVYSHYDLARLRIGLNAMAGRTELGDEEETITIAVGMGDPEIEEITAAIAAERPRDIQLSLWDPLVVLGATNYVSPRPAVRTVYTVQLTPPPSPVPVVTADGLDCLEVGEYAIARAS